MSARYLFAQSGFTSFIKAVNKLNLHDQWLSDRYIVSYINTVFNLQTDELKITTTDLNTAISRNPTYKHNNIKDHTRANALGLYSSKYVITKE